MQGPETLSLRLSNAKDRAVTNDVVLWIIKHEQRVDIHRVSTKTAPMFAASGVVKLYSVDSLVDERQLMGGQRPQERTLASTRCSGARTVDRGIPSSHGIRPRSEHASHDFRSRT